MSLSVSLARQGVATLTLAVLPEDYKYSSAGYDYNGKYTYDFLSHYLD
jgi:hypothetical protein